MKKNMIAVCAVFGVCLAAFICVAVLGIVYAVIPLIAVGALAALVTLWAFVGSVYRESVYERFEKKFAAREFLEALHLLDKASAKHFFFPVFRTTSYELYAKGELAVDNLAECARYVALLRRTGGEGWRYKTAFCFVLLHLDWGEYALAREEFSAFENACRHSKIYKEQIEILGALFAHIDQEGKELPESAKKSPYPVVGRILMKDYE